MRVLLAILLLLTLVTVAHARPLDLRLTLRPRPPATVPHRIELVTTPLLPSLRRLPSYVEEHSLRVQRDLLFFDHGYAIAELRERDQLRLYGPTPGGEQASELGAAVFASAVVIAAHAPAPLRRLVSGRLHVGPAILYGGMGAGAGGHF